MSTSMGGFSGYRGGAGRGTGQTMTGGNIIPKGYSQGQISNFTPEMMDLFKSLFSHVGPDSYISRLASGDQGMFEQLEEPAMRQFQQLQGQTASRFSGVGDRAMSSRGGSGFRNTMNQYTSDFAKDLQAQRLGLQNNAITSLRDMAAMLLGQRPHEQFLIKNQPRQSGWRKAAGIGLPILGAAAGGFFGGPAGAALGGQLGSAAASGFS